MVTFRIRRAMLSGITKREVLRWHTRHPICVTQDRQGQNTVTQTAVGMDAILPIFVLLSFGILLSVTVLVMEIGIHKTFSILQKKHAAINKVK